MSAFANLALSAVILLIFEEPTEENEGNVHFNLFWMGFVVAFLGLSTNLIIEITLQETKKCIRCLKWGRIAFMSALAAGSVACILYFSFEFCHDWSLMWIQLAALAIMVHLVIYESLATLLKIYIINI